MVSNILNPVGGVFLEPNRKNLAERVCYDFRAVRVIRIDENRSAAGHNIDQTPETEFDFIKVWKDIGVVKLDIVDDHGFGKVMEKFGPFIKKGRVVFVSFEDEIVRTAEGRALRQVSSDATDQKARVAGRFAKNPGDQRGGCGFSMRSRDHDIGFALQKEILERLRKRSIRKLSIQNRFKLRISATKSVPDDDQIHLWRDIFWSESARNFYSLRLEERGHWGIDVVVGSRDDETEFPERGGNRAHGSPANS
jgi:hypothetical protein